MKPSYALLSAVAATTLLAGCGSDSGVTVSSATNSGATTTGTAEPTSSSESSTESSTDTSGPETSSPTSSETSSPTVSETSSPTATDGALLDDAAIEAFATKLGCARERAVPPKSSWLLAKGVKTGYDCTAGDIEYTVMRTEKTEQIGPALAEIKVRWAKGKPVSYVGGTNWAILASPEKGKRIPGLTQTTEAQKKVGEGKVTWA